MQKVEQEVIVEPSRQFYSQEEVHEILELAIARQAENANQTELTRAQLLEIAEDMGIPITELTVAERDWEINKGESRERQAFDQFRRDRFRHRFVRYLIVNGALGGIALLSTGSPLGVPLIALFWGMFVALDAWNTFWSQGSDRYERAFEKWRRRKLWRRTINNFMERLMPR
ncbi:MULTISPECIES: 2TM domain-containing protein [unclassified Leptolyngbya]|uniref:2TM domain-containing protein n=1 Tax=unclassified Leptolyngbya TaxID=2650499 RepID=UPI001686C190|nr:MULTISPECIES: 2TM domain-containing protein [unclassified Leptolyngbya]MBD1909533.1 2TM domain-containing protein [Leptolyngbya sp. FACHB-8]MBD2154621.1 2TM domain-containing protein [Leptolyngbya sp. FACHB-16]